MISPFVYLMKIAVYSAACAICVRRPAASSWFILMSTDSFSGAGRASTVMV